MFCKHCGNQIADNSKFCPICGKALDTTGAKTGTQSQLHWICIFVAIGLVLLSLSLALDLGNHVKAEDVTLPAVLALGSIGLAGFVCMDTRKAPEHKTKHVFSLIVLIGGIVMAVELCIGPLIASLAG